MARVARAAVALSALTAASVACAVVVTLMTEGCAKVELLDAPDAGTTVCTPAPVVFCDASAPDPTSCAGNPNAPGPEKRMPAASFAAECRAYLLHENCDVEYACRCAPTDGGPSAWICL